MNFWFLLYFHKNSIFIFVFVVSILSFLIQKIHDSLYPSVILLADIDKCPACYGTNACNIIFQDNFKIKPFDIYSAMSHLFFSKNVFYGTMGEIKIVVKKLAHDIEHEAFDRMLCENIEFRSLCWKNNDGDKHYNSIDYNVHIENAVSLNSTNNYSNPLTLCPTTQYLRNLINQSAISNFDNLANLWTILKINPEPIILTLLPADTGWPVPKYYGACGRIIVESYVGLPLTLYYNEPWLRRAKIAIDLLEAAHIFTFNSAEYAYYLTDVSSDNIAIDNYDKPKFVDLENIFILSKNNSIIDRTKDWYDLHVSDNGIECENCFVFSPMDICSHQISDHNYYAICQHILHSRTSKRSIRGFLHSIPNDISNNYSEVMTMLSECAMPRKEHSRIIAADKLQKVLMKITKEVRLH